MGINKNIDESSANPALKSLEHKIQKQFNKGCVKYGLLEDGDKILVGLSGGKDSLMLLDLLRFSKMVATFLTRLLNHVKLIRYGNQSILMTPS